MASISTAEAQAWAAANYQGYLFSVAATTLIVYELILTLGDEIRLVWGRKNPSAILFFLNKFILLGLAVASALPMTTLMSCEGTSVLYDIVAISNMSVCAVVAAIRVHVVSGKKWCMSALVLLLGLVPVGTNLFLDSKTTYGIMTISLLAPNTCIEYYGFSNAVYMKSKYFTPIHLLSLEPMHISLDLFTTRIFAIVSDVAVLAVTWYYTYDAGQIMSHLIGRNSSTLAGLLLQDGTLYFVALVLLNVADIIFSTTGGGVGDGVDSLNAFIFPMSAILISRFLLHIREAAYHTHVDFGTETPSFVRSRHLLWETSQFSSVAFVGSGLRRLGDGLDSDTVVPQAGQSDVQHCAESGPGLSESA